MSWYGKPQVDQGMQHKMRVNTRIVDLSALTIPSRDDYSMLMQKTKTYLVAVLLISFYRVQGTTSQKHGLCSVSHGINDQIVDSSNTEELSEGLKEGNELKKEHTAMRSFTDTSVTFSGVDFKSLAILKTITPLGAIAIEAAPTKLTLRLRHQHWLL
jgi:hypothetical protein